MEISVSELSKGQTFMPDFMASMAIFAILIAVFLSTWNGIIINNTSGSEMLQARHTSTFLVSTQGYPENWEEDSVNVTIPGFASKDHVISPEKLREFREKTYDRQTELLQASDFYIELRNETDVLKLDGSNITYGENYTDASQIYPVRRSVLYNKSGELVEAELVYITWE